jgi:hypothetical protein
MRTLIVLFTSLLAACSKSPMDATLNSANAAATKLMAPLVQKDASRQVEGLIRTIDGRSACRGYIERLRDAGRSSPYEGATEMMIAHTYDAAGKAGCVKLTRPRPASMPEVSGSIEDPPDSPRDR